MATVFVRSSLCHRPGYTRSNSSSTFTPTMALVKVAILDDYQHVALTSADWSPIRDRVSIDVYDETLADEDALVQRLEPYTIICAMRERTKFTASLLDRLPNLRLIATTGSVNAGINIAHANKKGIAVSGTGSAGNATLEHIWALILATARYIALDDAGVKGRRQLWQTMIPIGLAGKTLGLVGVGRLGQATAKVQPLIRCLSLFQLTGA
jgi:26S proteasome regulatory subunit N2